MRESFMGGLPTSDVEEQKFIGNLVGKVQKKMNEEAFLIEERARGDYSGCLIELEMRMKNVLNPSQYKLFIKMRAERNAFPWPRVDVDE